MIIPDCTYCGDTVRLDFEFPEGEDFVHPRHLEAVEVCDGCGVTQKLIHHDVLPPRVAAEIRRGIRRAWARRRLDHIRCRDDDCTCLCHVNRSAA